MKTIGIIGGMSWESTRTYYELINTQVKQQLGGLHSAKIALISVDFAQVEAMQAQGDWQSATQLLIDSANKLAAAGADFFLIATNTMHKVAEKVQEASPIELLHIAEATGEALVHDQRQCVALLGTRFTMEEDFYKKRLSQKFGLDVMVPSSEQREVIHRVIYDELCVGKVLDESRQRYKAIIASMVGQGADSVVLGCTEIPLLIDSSHVEAPVYDTTAIHAKAAVRMALLNN